MPHFHLSGMQGVCIFLFVVATFGSLHLAASSAPDNKWAQSWLALGF